MASGGSRRGYKRKLVLDDDDEEAGGDVGGVGHVADFYRFKVLLPNGTAVGLRIPVDPKVTQMPLEKFVLLVKGEYFASLKQPQQSKSVNWKSQELILQDAEDKVIRHRIPLACFGTKKCHILRLHDGSPQVRETYENMWDLTLDTSLLKEHPNEYTFEAALADLIDNSLQAVWPQRGRRLIGVDVLKDRISIFDSSSGMDDSDENSISKWGKIGIGSTLPGLWKTKAIGGKPPYLMPFFGTLGYGGLVASMYLGRHAIVSSKTKESRKVYTLHLNRDALIHCSSGKLTRKTYGGMRNPLEDEIGNSPQGSFTKVEVFDLRMKNLDKMHIGYVLKDIYFPYIQCDEASARRKTIALIEFQVNGVDLAEIQGGEVSITNLHSCNGPDFVFELSFSANQGSSASKFQGLQASSKANASLKCVYFPFREGKESIQRILERLEAEGVRTKENYETFSRVSVRRLGRLLPDARWACLPFMDLRQKKGEKGHLLRRCYLRAKCFIDTDGGFNPTPSKMDLAHHNPFTMALKNIGSKMLEKETEVNVEILRDGEVLSPLQLEKEYQDWILHMHDLYDEEEFCGEDDPILVVGPTNKKKLKISSDVVRVHKVLKRKGISWKSGQRMKLLKGACPGVHENNIFATLEYFLIEGLPGDTGDDAGCKITWDEGNARLDIRGSLSLPISVIDSEKCQRVGESVWNCMLEKELLKRPFVIDMLCEAHCKELDVDGALSVDSVVAGCSTPDEIIAVLRPPSYNLSNAPDILDQKYIVKMDLLMSMEVKYKSEATDSQSQNICSEQVAPSSCKGFHGLYIFQLGCKFPDLFQKTGIYTFSFVANDPRCKECEKRIMVRASSEVKLLKLLSNLQTKDVSVSVGSSFPPFCIGCFDAYENQIPLTSIPKFKAKLLADDVVLAKIDEVKPVVLSDGLTAQVKDLLIEACNLDWIRPNYEATLVILLADELVLLSLPCQVFPGSIQLVRAQGPIQHLLPNAVVKELKLEMFDAYGNHAKKGSVVQLIVDGFCFVDKGNSECKVDENGCVDLSRLLKVTAGSGEVASIAVFFRNREVFRQEYHIDIPSSQQDGEIRVLHGPSLLEPVASIVKQIMDNGKSLENDIFRHGEQVGDCERGLQILQNKRAEIEESLLNLQAALQPASVDNLNCLITEEEVLQQIKNQTKSAASLICYLSRDFTFSGPQKSFMKDIVGVVALLGTVRTSKLSRILCNYLDKDHMLALVCRTFDVASALEEYDKNGDVALERGLHAEAAALGISISNHFLVICLEDTRPYRGKLTSDLQRKLLLPDPVLANGQIPPGFMGYAVNMIEVVDRHLDTRTTAGHGLRETLFYRLFGELQVYETREHMKVARSCITDGAVSLDGGILKGNGIACLGYRNCDVFFPVTRLSNGQEIYPHQIEVKKQIELKKLELEEVNVTIKKYARLHEKSIVKFRQKRDEYMNLLSNMDHAMEVEHSKSNHSSSTTGVQ